MDPNTTVLGTLTEPGLLLHAMASWPPASEEWSSLQVTVQVTALASRTSCEGFRTILINDGQNLLAVQTQGAASEYLASGAVHPFSIVHLSGLTREVLVRSDRFVTSAA